MADKDDQVQPRTGSTAVSGTARGHVVEGRLTDLAAANGAATRGKVAKRETEEIIAEIERTRENLARTIDALADRVSPANNVRRLRERALAELAKPEVQLAAAAIAVTLAGVAVVRIVSRRRGGRS